MRIVTKTGDEGATGLRGGHRVSKCDVRPEAFGTIDELSVELGLLVSLMSEGDCHIDELRRIQRDLFLIGGRVASLPESKELAELDELDAKACEHMEDLIESMLSALPKLRVFMVPSGSPASLQAQRARTICRRAERRLVAVAEQDARQVGRHDLGPELKYVNRLSDYLYALGRYLNHAAGIEEVPYR